eukprot:m.259831 g.259831  ORF g.259831 m.259831 type:complete len:986 (+) comp40427_c0_seq1:49-3006(+)
MSQEGVRPITLTDAAEEGSWDDVKEFVERDDDINQRGGTEATALWYAARSRNLEMCQWLVARGADPNVGDEQGLQPIHAAVAGVTGTGYGKPGYYSGPKSDCEVVLKFFLSLEGVIMNEVVDKEGRSPLHYCTSALVCKCLLDLGFDPFAVDSQGESAIHTSVYGNNAEVFGALLMKMIEQDAEVSNKMVEIILQCESSEQRAVMVANIIFRNLADSTLLQRHKPGILKLTEVCYDEEKQKVLFSFLSGISGLQQVLNKHLLEVSRRGTPERIQYLVSIGADVKCVDNNGNQPLHIAASEEDGAARRCQALIDCGASVAEKNDKGEQPLHVALKCIKEDLQAVCELLLRCGASVEARDNEQNQALHLAARVKSDSWRTRKLKSEKLCSLLIKKGADVHSKNGKGNQPLYEAAKMGLVKTCEVLISQKADVNAKNHKGNRPLHGASKSGSRAVCELSLQNGADLKAVNRNGDQALHVAAKQHCADICKYLIERGADPNARNSKGNTSLHTVFQGRSRSSSALVDAFHTVKSLISMGAHVSAANADGDQPLHCFASARKHYKAMKHTVDLLVKEGANCKAVNARGDQPLHSAVRGETQLFEVLLESYSDTKEDKMALQKAFGMVCDQEVQSEKEYADLSGRVALILSGLGRKDDCFLEQFKEFALKGIIHAAGVCNPVIFGEFTKSVVKALEGCSEMVLSAALEAIAKDDYPSRVFSLAAIILIGCGASLSEALHRFLDKDSRDLRKIRAFLMEHGVSIKADGISEKGILKSISVQYLKGKSGKVLGVENVTVVTELSSHGPLPVGRKLPLRVLETQLEYAKDMIIISRLSGLERVCYSKGVFRQELLHVEPTSGAPPPLRPRPSRLKFLKNFRERKQSSLDEFPKRFEIEEIVTRVASKWKDVANFLCLGDESISAIGHLHPGKLEKQWKAMFEVWSQNKDAATVHNLCSALMKAGLSTDAEKVFPEAVQQIKQRRKDSFLAVTDV